MLKHNRWEWIDIWNVLYYESIIFLGKPINEEIGDQLIATILYLDESTKLNLYINTEGGEVVPCLALFDTMRYIKASVSTTGFGNCLGMAGVLLALGRRGKRQTLRNSRIMLKHPTSSARGQACDIYREAREILFAKTYIDRKVSEQSGQPLEKVVYDLRRNLYLTPADALDYGLIDRIICPTNV